MMQRRRTDAGTSCVRSGGETKTARRAQCNWNRGGRLKELRIRHLARKFLHMWMEKTFGLVPPQKARSHYDSVVLRQAMGRWRDEWWMSRREWSLTTRAQCHYRYYLCNLAFHRWKTYISLQREKKSKLKNAQSYADRHRIRIVWERWEVFVETRRMKKRMIKSADEHNRLTTLQSAWSLWRTRLQQLQHLNTLEEQTVKQQALALKKEAWLQWTEMHVAFRCQKEKESRASLHFLLKLKRNTLHQWTSYVSSCQTKRASQAAAQRACYLRLVRTCWSRWRKALHRRWSEEVRLQAAGQLATQSTQRRALERWRTYVTLCRNKAEMNQIAIQHHQHQLLSSGLQRLFLNVTWNKKHRLSNNMALQHYHQTIMRRFWRLWQDRLEEAEDKSFHPQIEKAATNYRRSREHQACHQGDLCRFKWAPEKLKKAEELHRKKTQNFLRRVLSVWRENTGLQAESRHLEQRAQNHSQHFILSKVFIAWREVTTLAVIKHHQQGEAVSRAQRAINQVFLLQSFTQWRKRTREARKERMCMEKARWHHEAKLLSKALKHWNKHQYQNRKNKVMKRQGILLLKLKMYQTYYERWKTKLQHRRREAKQTEKALWHWSLTLQSKVLYGWRLMVTEQRQKQEQAASAARVYRDQLLREGVTCILTYAAHMNDLTPSLTQHSQEQRSRHLQRVVRRCAMRWKQRAICKPQREKAALEQLRKKKVTFCLTTRGPERVPASHSVEQDAEHLELSKLLPTNITRRQPRRCREQFESSLSVLLHTSCQNSQTGLHPADALVSSTHPCSITSTVSPSEAHASVADSSQGSEDLLLPPSAFMNTGSQSMLGKSRWTGDIPCVSFHQFDTSLKHYSRYPETEGLDEEEARTDPMSFLTRELLSIQLNMKSFQRDRKQLRSWQKLREVLQGWLQTSGEDEQMEKNSVSQELKELDERIDRLSSELTNQKPKMLLHAERVQRLQTALHTSGVIALSRKRREMETVYNVTGNRTGPHTLPE